MAKKKKKSGNALEVQNAAKTLYANIRFMSVDDPISTIVITSSVPNEGKTALAVQLGQAIATSGKSVLLVEADMRRRSLSSRLQIRSSAGIYAVLTESVPLNRAILATGTPNLYFLDAEPNIPNPADLLSSKRYAAFVAALRKHYDYVIFDTPPVGTFVDAAIVSTLADGTILAVKPNLVKRSELLGAYEQLQKAQANVIGLCATFVEGTGSEYYYAYYTSSGKRIDKNEAAAIQQTSGAPAAGAGASAGAQASAAHGRGAQGRQARA